MSMKTPLIAGICTLIGASSVLADAGHEQSTMIGAEGQAAQVDRVVEVEMDEMSFSPSDVSVERGETIRFVVTNTGRMVHEFNIGTDAMHDAHGQEMRAMMQKGLMTTREIREDKMKAAGMMHDDPSSVLLEPGETAEVIWTFSGDSDLELACNVPGHRAGGMTGEISIEDQVADAG